MDGIANLFAPIMVIGTIMALIFATGALWNSISRRRLYVQSQLAEEEEKIVFRPPTEQTVEQVKETPPPPEPATAVFRQMGPTGKLSDDPVDEEDDLYVWE